MKSSNTLHSIRHLSPTTLCPPPPPPPPPYAHSNTLSLPKQRILGNAVHIFIKLPHAHHCRAHKSNRRRRGFCRHCRQTRDGHTVAYPRNGRPGPLLITRIKWDPYSRVRARVHDCVGCKCARPSHPRCARPNPNCMGSLKWFPDALCACHQPASRRAVRP